MVPGTAAGIPARFTERQPDFHREAASEVTGRTFPESHRARHLVRDRRDHWRQHDGELADFGAVLVCAAKCWSCRSDFWQAAEFLPVQPARMAAHHWMATHAGDYRLHRCRFLSSNHREHPNLRRPETQIHPAAVAWVLYRVRVFAASPRDPGVYQPLPGVNR